MMVPVRRLLGEDADMAEGGEAAEKVDAVMAHRPGLAERLLRKAPAADAFLVGVAGEDGVGASPFRLPAAPSARSPAPRAARCGRGRIARASRRRRCRAAHSRHSAATSRITGSLSAGSAPSRRVRTRGAGFGSDRSSGFVSWRCWVRVGPAAASGCGPRVFGPALCGRTVVAAFVAKRFQAGASPGRVAAFGMRAAGGATSDDARTVAATDLCFCSLHLRGPPCCFWNGSER